MKIFYLFILSYSLFLQQINALEISDNQSDYPYQLSICSVFRDEACFLKEWIEFHLLVGVEHFYLFNNLSEDDYISVLQPYINKKIVELVDWPFENVDSPDWNAIQCAAFQRAIQMATFQTKWLAVIDSDEFIIPVQTDNLVHSLQEFEEYGGVQINWQCYGTSNIEYIPIDKLLIELLVMKAPENYIKNQEVKSIVRPECVLYCSHQHYAIYKPNYYHVNEKKERIPEHQWRTDTVCLNKFRINHYWTRDKKFFQEVKMKRAHVKDFPDSIILQVNNDVNKIFDPVMLRFTNQLKEKMCLNNQDL